MIHAVRLSRSAERDLRQAFDWYDRRRVGLGRAFLDEFRRTADVVARHPEASMVIHRDLRRSLVRRFPFAIFYTFDGVDVFVHAVLHCRRTPARWSVNEAPDDDAH